MTVIVAYKSQLSTNRSRKGMSESRALTECVKSLDDVARLPKGVLVEAMAGEAVHLLLVSLAKSSRNEHQFQTRE